MTGLMIVLVGIVFGLMFLARRESDEAFEQSREPRLDLAPSATAIPEVERLAYRDLCRDLLRDAVGLHAALEAVAKELEGDDLDVPARALEAALEQGEASAERLSAFSSEHHVHGEAGEWLSHGLEQLEAVLTLGEQVEKLEARDRRFTPAALEQASDALDLVVLAGADFCERMLGEKPLVILGDAVDSKGQTRFNAMRERALSTVE